MAVAAETDLLASARAGDRRAIAKLLTAAETLKPASAAVMERVYREAGRAQVIGVTGPPGAGKSSLVNALTKEFRGLGRTVGIVAIDPSSPFSGGAILGDRVRMGDLGGDDGVFIRSLATQGAMGGLARPALDAVDVLDACGFDLVIVETVGVGQDEVDIAGAADTVIVASPPGLGDGIQAMKAGLLEIADIHVVTKGDRSDAATTAGDLKGARAAGRGAGDRGTWKAPVLLTSAATGLGIADLARAALDHARHLKDSGEDGARKRRTAALRLEAAAADLLRREVHRLLAARPDLVDALAERRADPRQAARELVDKAFKGQS